MFGAPAGAAGSGGHHGIDSRQVGPITPPNSGSRIAGVCRTPPLPARGLRRPLPCASRGPERGEGRPRKGVQMVSLDVRTRVDADIRPIDAVSFFETELPALV